MLELIPFLQLVEHILVLVAQELAEKAGDLCFPPDGVIPNLYDLHIGMIAGLAHFIITTYNPQNFDHGSCEIS